jgi:hypothetical protein
MTPKQKAKDLVFNFCDIDSDSEMYDGFKMPNFYAQRCAMISVDEIIGIKLFWFQKDTKELNYWIKVKQEIEKM